MKLSEAIRLGAMLKPQGFLSHSCNANAARTCALGAAAQALGEPDGWELYKRYSSLSTHIRACPECDSQPGPDGGLDIVYHLNDCHKWPRERTADWVATIEAQHEQQDAPQPEPVEVRA
jgi:hypothetical protein